MYLVSRLQPRIELQLFCNFLYTENNFIIIYSKLTIKDIKHVINAYLDKKKLFLSSWSESYKVKLTRYILKPVELSVLQQLKFPRSNDMKKSGANSILHITHYVTAHSRLFKTTDEIVVLKFTCHILLCLLFSQHFNPPCKTVTCISWENLHFK